MPFLAHLPFWTRRVPTRSPHHSRGLRTTAGSPQVSPPQRVSPPERHEIVKFVPNFCSCAVDQEKAVLKGNGPFLAHLPFWTFRVPPGSPHHSGVSPPQQGLPSTERASPPQRGLPTTAGPHHGGVSPPQRGFPTTTGSPHQSGTKWSNLSQISAIVL